MCTALVLINRRTKNDQGEWVDTEPTRRHIKAWRGNAQRLAQLPSGTTVVVLPSGTTVVVIGTVTTETWADKNTHEKRTRETVTVDSLGQGLMLPRAVTGEHITIQSTPQD